MPSLPAPPRPALSCPALPYHTPLPLVSRYPTLFAHRHPPSPFRNVTSSPTTRVAARHVSVFASSASALARSDPNGSRSVLHVCATHALHSLTRLVQENNNVSVFREKIKDYLAAQGMIKGHSGSGARTSENEGILLLVPDARSDMSSSPTPLSPSSSDDHGPRYNSGLEISAVRDHYSSLPMHTHHSSYSTFPPALPHYFDQTLKKYHYPPPAPYTLPELSPDSDRGHSILPNGNDLMLPSYGQPSNILPPPSLVSLSSCKTTYRY